MAYELNEKQQIAVNKLHDFVGQNIHKIFYLLGYAGTGKTFIIAKILNDFLMNNNIDKIIITAPTHQALNVIESYIKSNTKNNPAKINFMTLHKLLEFKPIIMNKNGEKIFNAIRESKYLKQMENKIIIIDESSMIPDNMVKHLKKYVELYPIKLIILGDCAQLPPIGETLSTIFNIKKKYEYHIQLDFIMRTNSPDIKDVCTIIRNWNRSDSLKKLLLPIHNRRGAFRMYHSICANKADPLKSTWFKKFAKKINSGENPIILTWTNPRADYYNSLIRKYIHKTTNLTTYAVGDCAIFNNYYLSPIDHSNFYTSDMIIIKNITTEEKILYNWIDLLVPNPKIIPHKNFNEILNKFLKYPQIKINIMNVMKLHSSTCSEYKIKTICRQDLEKYNSMLKNIKEKIEFFFGKYGDEILTTKLWNVYHKYLIEPYAEIKFGYSITTHKAQGSTFGTVIVDFCDISENPDANELQKALYTAAGRASNELYFLF